ncbi:ABC transporter ATP-binding protein [Pararhizobium mangrovi]|uniref:sn-glycerol-3-phosphate ABC transporter ATP-binding protein UgpC n=1 Tax=Pararhizobium mangrovi TaxID=2590452 RepID=A0A506TZP6_9HYPH|nr:sn-glycerol-3-phosphate ABC transporter ATP-binding protein UgpC [Pararhizobium mangrovi]TPW27552.1 sn-glycerol-3-phosphate ABC transporter ATP-binding protein UgpC [Pararhizobium mangrovi]
MAELTLRGVSKRFADVEVLKDIDLHIEQGEFVVLVGPSGCGKSTLLRLVSGLEKVSSGEIAINGKRIDGIGPAERDLAMVFQSYALYPHMSVRRNLSYSLRIRKMSRVDIDERVSEASRILGIEPLLDRLPKQLSGGQRQRVAMGRAIVRDPQAFLFDEPLSNLDAGLRVQMRKEIRELHQRLGATSIYVTHDQIEAMTMADRIVVMRAGRIEQIGSPMELYERPANRFVAGFIGSPAMNFLRAKAVRRDGTMWITLTETSFPAPKGVTEGEPVVVGLRPDAISLVKREGNEGAAVILVEPTGRETLVECSIGEENIEALVTGKPDVAPGDAVGLAFDFSRAHVFRETDGMRLSQ